jgi:hypothetical protein
MTASPRLGKPDSKGVLAALEDQTRPEVAQAPHFTIDN